jgi:hypothetical protein
MILKDQVYAHAALLAGQLEEEQGNMLRALCTAATVSLAARLRDGLQPEDCRADFVAAASLYALAELNAVRDGTALEQITAGDLTLRKSASSDPASRVLRGQAQLMIAPYLKDNFCFRGV